MNRALHASARPYFVGAALAALCVFLAHLDAAQDLLREWQTEEYSHGFLIPFVALLIGWHLLSEKRPLLRPSWSGLALLALAVALQIIAHLSAFQMAGELGLVVAMTAISLGFFGCAATYAVAPALVYLLFAIPLPHLLQANMSEQLQLWSSTLGVWPLDLLGVPVFQQGNVIDLGNFKLQIVEACSGLRYLFPLMSFGYLIAFLLEDKWWKRIAIFLSSIPITIFLNALRIAFIGFTVDVWGPKMASGFLHDFEGWSVFVICIAVMLAETWILMRIGSRGRLHLDYLGPAQGPLFGAVEPNPAPTTAFLIASVLFAAIFSSGIIDQREEIIPKHPPLASFPLTLGAWQGRPQSMDADMLDALRLSDYWIADYRMPNEKAPVDFYIAYYDRQRFGSSTHSPSNCIPGGGWQIDNSRVITAPAGRQPPVSLTRLLIRRGDETQLVYYWFEERGRDLTETTSAKWYLLWDSFALHRTDGALIRLITPLASNEPESAADKRLQSFLAVAAPSIHAFIPGAATMNSIDSR